jgi:curved DNA-binding protein CbpA
MEASMFTDHYEVLEISPNANSETIERIFRYLASRYHPDNQDTGDPSRFRHPFDACGSLSGHPRFHQRRRRLTKGPEEFREVRVDRPNAKGNSCSRSRVFGS